MAAAHPSENFDVDLFETRLEALKDTQEGIQQMSSWCLQQRNHHKKIVSSWLNVFKRVRVEHRLTLFYLANDVIQYSKRKRYEFVESWATALQKATTMVRDDKVKNKILRIFHIWEQREIYSEEYLSDLCGLLNITPPKSKSQHQVNIESDDFQNNNLITTVRECVELSEATDKSFKKLPKLPNWDIENIKLQLKDKTHSDDVEKEIERYITYIEVFNKNLQTEIKSRKMVLNNLDAAIKFYANQRGEVKVVVSAYKNFGSRIKLVKKKLDEISPNLPSPIPSPDINAPSPEPDNDIQLPGEQTPISMNFLKTNFNGYSSYLDGNLPFDINDFKRDDNSLKSSSQRIEVIGSRLEEENNFNSNNEYYKAETINAYPGTSNMQIPGLSPVNVNVPAVPSGGYTSLARAAQQYTDVLQPPPNPPLFGILQSHCGSGTPNSMHHNINSTYASNYNSDTYGTNAFDNNNTGSGVGAIIGGGGGGSNPSTNNASGNNNSMIQPLLPPPPLPNLDVSDHANGTSSNNLNTTWDLNMNWTNPLDTSTATAESSTSPAHGKRETLNNNLGPLEYNEHDNSLRNAQDVDHRQLHLSAFGINSKLGLSKEKSRQLDIDHRNLISLTGSPGTNDNEINKKLWLSTEDKFKTSKSGDVDYRTFGQNIKAIETTTSLTTLPNKGKSNDTNSTTNQIKQINSKAFTSSPPKDNTKGVSSELQKEEIAVNANSGGTSYDPTDMVVDMDMSDEDLDDIFREVNEQKNESISVTTKDAELQENYKQDEKISEDQKQQQQHEQLLSTAPKNVHSNVSLLETPNDYEPPGTWGESIQEDINHHNERLEMDINQTVDWQQMSWNNNTNNNNNDNRNNNNNNNKNCNNNGNNNMRGNLMPPPSVRPPYTQMPPYGYADAVAGYVDNRGGKNSGGGASGSGSAGNSSWIQPFPPNLFTRLPRAPSSGTMNPPYYNRCNSSRGMGVSPAGKIRGNPFRGSGNNGSSGSTGGNGGRFRGKSNWI